MNRDRRIPWLGATALLGAFALGVGVGTWWDVGAGTDNPRAVAGGPAATDYLPADDVEAVTMESGSSVFEDLDLSEAQQTAIDSILDEFSAWSDSALVREATRAQRGILGVLEPAQRERYLTRIDSVGAVMRIRKIRFKTGGAEP